MARILITRAEPAASVTADLVRALGHVPILAPLTNIVPLKDGIDRLDRIASGASEGDACRLVLATSVQAIEMVKGHGFSPWARRQRWAVVGDRAGGAVHALGAPLVLPPAETVDALVAALSLSADMDAFDHTPLYLAAADRRPILEEAFPDLDVLALYEARALGRFSERHLGEMQNDPPDVVLAYSARGARLAVDALLSGPLVKLTMRMGWACLSDAVADAVMEALGTPIPLLVANRPSETALMEAVSQGLSRDWPQKGHEGDTA